MHYLEYQPIQENDGHLRITPSPLVSSGMPTKKAGKKLSTQIMNSIVLNVEMFEVMIGKKNGKEMLQAPVPESIII